MRISLTITANVSRFFVPIVRAMLANVTDDTLRAMLEKELGGKLPPGVSIDSVTLREEKTP
jgi:hypothetical protein